MGDPAPMSRGWTSCRVGWLSQVPASEGPGRCDTLRGGGCRSLGVRAHPKVPSLSLLLGIWTAHSGLFAHCLAFVQVFNSLQRLEENSGRQLGWRLGATTQRSGARVA